MPRFNQSYSASRPTGSSEPAAAPEAGEPLAVLKLGGSVLRNEADLRSATHEIYRWLRRGYKVVAVVSALTGVTDELVAQAARYGERPEPSCASLLTGTGELASASLLGLALDKAGVRATVAAPWQIGLRAEGDLLDASLTDVDPRAVFALLGTHDVVVVPGFIALDARDRLVLLGRGGSDLSAIFLAHRLEASVCRLVKDVDGLYERDPRESAPGETGPRRYASLPFALAEELGGKIVQAKAVRAARGWHRSFELGAIQRDDATRVGELPVAFDDGKRTKARKKVVLLGCGTVGRGVFELLRGEPDCFEVVRVFVRDAARARESGLPSDLLTTDVDRALAESADIVVELLGGTDLAVECIRRALLCDRTVVTANKSALAKHGDEPWVRDAVNGGRLLHSAAVGGAVPLLERVLGLGKKDPVVQIEGVINGTTNAILEGVAEGRSFDDAVRAAREAGFAERDVTRDLSGEDVVDKLRILARLAFGASLAASDVQREPLSAETVAAAVASLGEGERLRYVARLAYGEQGPVASVGLGGVNAEGPLARVPAAANAAVVTPSSGRAIVLGGKGAGRWPTAEAVLGDLFSVA